MAFHQFQKHVDPLLWPQVCVELIVSAICIFKTAEHLNDSIHAINLACADASDQHAAVATMMSASAQWPARQLLRFAEPAASHYR